MARPDMSRSGWKYLLILVALLGGALAGACSAGSKQDDSNPFGTGSTPGNGGFISGSGGIINGGGVAGSGNFIGSGGTTGNGGGAGTGGLPSNVVTCPAPINRCADNTPFANASPGTARLLYPYNNTVFPRGLGSPTFQWDTGTPTNVKIEMVSSGFTYTECFGGQAAANIKIPQDAWDAQGACAKGETDPVTVTITTVVGGQARTITTTIFFALATIRTPLYYNTYQTAMAASGAGAVMKITPGAPQNPSVFLSVNGIYPTGPCVSCHSLSSNGQMMIANNHTYPGGPYQTGVYDVSSGTPTSTLTLDQSKEAGFAGIYPDGTLLMTNGPKNPSTGFLFPAAAGQPVALIGPATSRLLDTATGNVVTAPGWTVQHANMPTFSPDGKHMVYNDQDQNNSHSLWVVDFEVTTKTFSNPRQVYNDAVRYPGWPFFTPDSKQVIFVLGTANDFTSQIPNQLTFAPFTPCSNSHLMIVDVATGQSTPLNLANGYSSGTTTYLPNNDPDLEFYSTVSPVAAGGYFWAFFTSRRSYGNLYNKGKEDYTQKKIWATAISIGKGPGVDPSHPAFYVEGQELATGNMRAFAALEACKEDGSPCTGGSDCCSGYCTNIDPATGIGVCGIIQVNTGCKNAQGNPGSRVDDKCSTEADCCVGTDNGANGSLLYCIANFCAIQIE